MNSLRSISSHKVEGRKKAPIQWGGITWPTYFEVVRYCFLTPTNHRRETKIFTVANDFCDTHQDRDRSGYLMRYILTKSHDWLAKIHGLTRHNFIDQENIFEIIFFRCSRFAEEKVVIYKKKVTDSRCLSTSTNTMSFSGELVMFDKSGRALGAQNVQVRRDRNFPMWSPLKRKFLIKWMDMSLNINLCVY